MGLINLIQLILFFSILPVYALECNKELQFEYLESGKKVNEKKVFCVLNDKKSFITKDCLKDCELKKSDYQKINLPTGYGTPSHIECRKYGGLPMIVSFSGKTIKTKTVLCKFADSSMGTIDMLGIWK